MVTKRDDDNRVNIDQSASGRWTGRVLQYIYICNRINIFLLLRRGTQKPFQFVLEPNVWWEVVLNISLQVKSFICGKIFTRHLSPKLLIPIISISFT